MRRATAGRSSGASRCEQRYGEARAYMQRPLERLADHANVGRVHRARVIGYQTIAISRLAILAVTRRLDRKRTYVLLEQVRGGEPNGCGDEADQKQGENARKERWLRTVLT